MTSTVTASEQSAEALFVELRRTGKAENRNALIERHLPLARRLALRYRYTPQPIDDLIQVANLGLIKAVDAFDPVRGSSFAAFAVPTILGELRRSMRSSAWAVHVPRALQERVAAVQRAERALSSRSSSPPTVQELAAEAHLTVEQVLEGFAVADAQDAVPLDAIGDLGDTQASEYAAADERIVLGEVLAELAPREQRIVLLRFVEGLTQTEIAGQVGLSQMQVSRILRKTLEELREALRVTGDG